MTYNYAFAQFITATRLPISLTRGPNSHESCIALPLSHSSNRSEPVDGYPGMGWRRTSVADTSGFGTSISTLTTSGITAGGVNFSVTATVYECTGVCGDASLGQYTYVYSVAPASGSNSLTQISLTNGGQFQEGSTNYGVVTGSTTMPDPSGVNFLFSLSTKVDTPASTYLPANDTLTFYIQLTVPPGYGLISGQDGSLATGQTLDPVPEPQSMALFGSGLAFGAFAIRRRWRTSKHSSV